MIATIKPATVQETMNRLIGPLLGRASAVPLRPVSQVRCELQDRKAAG